MNQDQNTIKIQKLTELEVLLSSQIERYGKTIGLFNNAHLLVKKLDEACDLETVGVINKWVNDSDTFVFQMNPLTLRHMHDYKRYVTNTLSTMGMPSTETVFQKEDITTQLICAFARYQTSYGIPADFGIIARDIVSQEMLRPVHLTTIERDPTYHNLMMLSDPNKFPLDSSSKFSKVVKSSDCTTMEFRRNSANCLPSWDTIALDEVGHFLRNLIRRHNFWVWFEQRNNELHRDVTSILTSHFEQADSFTPMGTLMHPSMFSTINFSGFIDFENIRRYHLSKYENDAMLLLMANQISRIHTSLMIVRAYAAQLRALNAAATDDAQKVITPVKRRTPKQPAKTVVTVTKQPKK